MKDLQGNEIKQPEIELKTIQDIKDCSRAIIEGTRFAVGIAREGITGLRVIFRRLLLIEKECTTAPSHYEEN